MPRGKTKRGGGPSRVAAGPSLSPPISNRGGLLQEGNAWRGSKGAHLDWLRVSVSERVGPAGQVGVGELFRGMLRTLGGIHIAPGSMRHYPESFGVFFGSTYLGGYGFGAAHGRACFQLTGRGCEAVSHWGNVYHFLVVAEPKLTRLDTAVDFYEGEVTVDMVRELYESGAFDRRGRRPGHSLYGPWCDPRQGGRTFQVEGGSWTIVAYEKGKKEGGPEAWVRVEVRTNGEAELGVDAMLNPDAHWRRYVGPLADWVTKGGSVVRVRTEREKATLERQLEYASVAAGAVVARLLASGFSPADVCAMLAAGRLVESFSTAELQAANEYWARVCRVSR